MATNPLKPWMTSFSQSRFGTWCAALTRSMLHTIDRSEGTLAIYCVKTLAATSC